MLSSPGTRSTSGADAESLACSLGAKHIGRREWQANCPYHDDSTPSLSIGEGEDGRVLVHCQAGCERVFERLVSDGILAGAARQHADDAPDARYQYRDATGALAYEVLRFSGKRFGARRLDGAGGWAKDVPKELRVPYHLPEVLSAPPDAVVFVVEGEKDADTLARSGYVATTNPFGAGKWLPQYNQHLSGRHVVIVPDNDESGRRHAEQVRHHLEPVAASVRVLSLAGLVGEAGDVSDLIATSGADAFVKLLKALPPPTLTDKPFLSLAELAHLPRLQWLVDGLVPRQGFCMLYGDPGVGKTFIAIDMSVRIAAGEPTLGRASAAGLVFYVALEGHGGLCDRVSAAGKEIELLDSVQLPFVVRMRHLDLLTPESVSELVSAVQAAASVHRASPALVVIDTLARAMPGADENSPIDMNRAVHALSRIKQETGAAVIVIHHSGKTAAKGPRGHSSLRAAVDTELLVSAEKGRRALTVTKQRDGADQITIGFDLLPKTVPVPDGAGVASTQIVRVRQGEDAEPSGRLNTRSALALKALKSALRESGRRLPAAEAAQLGIPAGVPVVTRDDWMVACRTLRLSNGGDDALRRARNRAAKDLHKAGLLGEHGDYCWLIPQAEAARAGQDRDSGTGQDGPGRTKKKKRAMLALAGTRQDNPL